MYCNALDTRHNGAGSLPAPLHLFKTAVERLQRYARACDRILKVARTAAELANSPDIRMENLVEEIYWRHLAAPGRVVYGT